MLHNLSHHGKDIERRLISRIGSLGPLTRTWKPTVVSSRARGGISNRFEVAVVANPSATGTEGPLSVCAVTRRRFSSGCKAHPAIAPAGSNRGRHGGDEMSEAPG